jgi:hypothetical protein
MVDLRDCGGLMETRHIIAELDREIARLRQARVLLSGRSDEFKATIPKRRTLSAEARKRIADAQKKRWAKVRKDAK